MLFDVVQRFTQTLSPKDMARSPREKQREREVFEAFLPDCKGRIENQSFAKSFVVSTFTAQKKGSSQICDRTMQRKQKNRKTELKKTGIAPIV